MLLYVYCLVIVGGGVVMGFFFVFLNFVMIVFVKLFDEDGMLVM